MEAINVLLGMVFVALAGVIAFVGAWLVTRHMDRKEAEEREAALDAEKQPDAQAQKTAGGGGGPDPVR